MSQTQRVFLVPEAVMSNSVRKRSVAWTGVLVATLAVLIGIQSPQAADPPAEAALPIELQYVPTDAVGFVHLDVQSILQSPLGKTFLRAKIPVLDAELKEITEAYGLTLADIRTFTAYVPGLAANGPEFAFILTTHKDYDRKKIVAELEELHDAADGKYENKNNVIRITSDAVGDSFMVDLSDLRRIVIGSQLPEDPKPNAKRKAGVLTPILKQHAGAALLAGFNPAKVPEAIRDFLVADVPAELRSLGTFFQAESVGLRGHFADKYLHLSATIQGGNRKEVGEALTQLRKQATNTLETESAELDVMAEIGDDVKEYRPLFTVAKQALKGLEVKAEDKLTTVKLAIPTELPFGPYVELLSGARTSKLVVERNNLKQMSLALFNHHDAIGNMPPAYSLGENDKPLHSWRVLILPYIEQEALFQKFKLDEPWDSEHNAKVAKDHPMPEVFLAPGDKAEDKKTPYRVFGGNGAGLSIAANERLTIAGLTDGTSNTISIVTAAESVPWTKPEALPFDPQKKMKPLLKFRGERCNIAMFDGSTRAIKKSIAEETLKAALTRAGGEVLGGDW